MSKYYVFAVLSLVAFNVYADDFSNAVNAVKTNCGNISEQLSDLKKMAGINTAITGVGTAAATGATVVGIVKASKDKELRKILESIDNSQNTTTNPQTSEVVEVADGYIVAHNIQSKQKSLTKQSKALGNWRTALLGTGTATNVAGAIISGKNKIDDDFQTQIDNCIKSVDNLKNSIGQARTDGLDVTRANKIVSECDKWKYTDLSIVNNRAKGAMISSIIGATTGAAGTATSAMANSDSVRSGDDTKEKNLNTASNILAGGTAVASGVATVFNATQISAVKKILDVANNCEEALK